jgi:HK97 family phage major capsid protein/HK97 family phage prohead protease
MNRAYSVLAVKTVDEDKRTIQGIATTPSVDRVGDVIEPLGVKFKNPLPLLLHHQHNQPVGTARFAKPTKDGVEFEAKIPRVAEPGTLKDRVDEAWQSIKAGLIRGVSIGFRPIRPFEESIERIEDGGLRFLKTEVLELSLVAVPANQDATITLIRSLDTVAAPGRGRVVQLHPPGATGKTQTKTVTPTEGTEVKTFSEQIKDFEAKRAARAARGEEIMNKAAEEQRTLEANEEEEHDTIQEELAAIDKHLVRLNAMAEQAKKKAAPVVDVTDPASAGKARAGIIQIKSDLAKGTAFTRYAMAIAAGKGSLSDAIEYAKRWEQSTPEVLAYIKATAGQSHPGSGVWGSELVYQQNLASEFVELLRAATIIGKINGFRMVPFNVRIPRQIGGSTVNWVGEMAPKPVSELDFDTISLGYNKVAGIVVLTDELIRLSTPSAEAAVRRDLVEQIARFIDQQFTDPAVTAGANNPASITNGVVAIPASGTDADALYADLNAALATFDDTDVGTASLVMLMPNALARGISTLRNPLGQFEFSSLSMAGGTLNGFQVIVSNTIPAGTIIILKADEVFMADDGQVSLDASNQATLDMNGGASPTFNLWQRNCIGIRAERWITWAKRRPDAVALITGATYGPVPGS